MGSPMLCRKDACFRAIWRREHESRPSVTHQVPTIQYAFCLSRGSLRAFYMMVDAEWTPVVDAQNAFDALAALHLQPHSL